MTNKAIVYSSTLGKTRKIAKYVAKELKADSFDLKKQTVINLSEYTHIIFGTGIHGGKPYGAIVRFLNENKDQLTGKKITLFVSCKFDGEKGEAQIKKVSGELGISNAFFFPGKGEKNNEGMSASVDAFIKEMSRK
ncbi:MAG: flavodoxin domain-containing protein [Candidatus Methanoplasma sp.]|jgi:menaquinone-dependent protoporphyrinogen oxidase|nr:flavodoxin domain-containing protein [Candidatus Methanoplasma sp.]